MFGWAVTDGLVVGPEASPAARSVAPDGDPRARLRSSAARIASGTATGRRMRAR